jgi:hypothetical protein
MTTAPDPVAEQAAAELIAKTSLQVDNAIKAAIRMLTPVAFEIRIAEIRAGLPDIEAATTRQMFETILADEEKTAVVLGKRCAAKWRSEAIEVAAVAMDILKADKPQAAVQPERLFYAALAAMLKSLSERALKLSETQTSERQET